MVAPANKLEMAMRQNDQRWVAVYANPVGMQPQAFNLGNVSVQDAHAGARQREAEGLKLLYVHRVCPVAQALGLPKRGLLAGVVESWIHPEPVQDWLVVERILSSGSTLGDPDIVTSRGTIVASAPTEGRAKGLAEAKRLSTNPKYWFDVVHRDQIEVVIQTASPVEPTSEAELSARAESFALWKSRETPLRPMTPAEASHPMNDDPRLIFRRHEARGYTFQIGNPANAIRPWDESVLDALVLHVIDAGGAWPKVDVDGATQVLGPSRSADNQSFDIENTRKRIRHLGAGLREVGKLAGANWIHPIALEAEALMVNSMAHQARARTSIGESLMAALRECAKHPEFPPRPMTPVFRWVEDPEHPAGGMLVETDWAYQDLDLFSYARSILATRAFEQECVASKRTFHLTLSRSRDEWSLYAPGVTEEQIDDGGAASLVSGAGDPTGADYLEAANVAAQRAAKRIGGHWDRLEQRCIFRDRATNLFYECRSLDDMLRLRQLQESQDGQVRSSALMVWMAERKPVLTNSLSRSA